MLKKLRFIFAAVLLFNAVALEPAFSADKSKKVSFKEVQSKYLNKISALEEQLRGSLKRKRVKRPVYDAPEPTIIKQKIIEEKKQIIPVIMTTSGASIAPVDKSIDIPDTSSVDPFVLKDARRNNFDADEILDFEEALSIAKKYSFELKTAEAEKNAVKAKRNEALRKLFPNLFVEGSKTTGDILEDVAFEEKKYGVSLEHTLFASGHLKATYKQAKKQFETALAQYKKADFDLKVKVSQLYYDLVKSVMVDDINQKLRQSVFANLQNSEEMFKQGLITEEEHMEVRTRYNQVEFQSVSSYRDVELARFKLIKELGARDAAELERLSASAVNTELKFKGLTLDLDDIVSRALDGRQEMKIAKLTLDAQKLGKKIARSKDGFKIDINGFAGRSASYYVTEPASYKNDWNIMVKVSKSFGPNSADYNYTREDTSPKLGQTDRTENNQHSVKLGLFDNFDKYSRIHRADADYAKAEKELFEAEREVGTDAYQSYFDYQENVLRLRNSMERIKLAEQRFSSLEYQHGLNQVPLSQLIDAKIKLTDERVLHVQALADYAINLYKLDKAVGSEGAFTGLLS